MSAPTDPIISNLAEASETLVVAGTCYLSGDLAGAATALDDVLVVVRDARAAIRHAAAEETA